MKRELKDWNLDVECYGCYYCKAHPDEKGTESSIASLKSIRRAFDCKAHPDEKGTESEQILQPLDCIL